MGNNLEEALGLLRQYPRQVSCPNPKPLKTHLHTVHSPPHYRHNHHPHSQTTPLNDGISFDFWDNVLILSLSIEKIWRTFRLWISKSFPEETLRTPLVEPALLWGSQSRMATPLEPEKYGRINFSWSFLGQHSPKLVPTDINQIGTLPKGWQLKSSIKRFVTFWGGEGGFQREVC